MLSPKQVRFFGLFGPAGEAQDLSHVCEGAAIGRLGDEDGPAEEKDEERDPEAHCWDDVAQLEAEILLDVGYASQRQDCSQVNAPVEPVEKSACGLWSPVFDLRLDTG